MADARELAAAADPARDLAAARTLGMFWFLVEAAEPDAG
jgi:hypothetical protein